ncbi:MAG: hypothetical protein JNL39_04625 [Opitutaceae bacterium]|nr:hypothetical protein [Opitutaceae bacterium]
MNPTASRLIRRTHMYLALFLTPWMIIYALSGLALNHGETVRGWFGRIPEFERIDERPYAAAFPADATPRQMAGQILADLGLAGTFNLPPNQPAGRLVIMRNAAFAAHRITWFRAESRLLVEKQAYTAPVIVNRAHFRSGYHQPYLAAKIWGAVVDLAIVGMLFWILSGILMWWEIKPARAWGAVCAVGGLGIFGVLLATI